MAYATVNDVQARLSWTMSDAQASVCATLLDDAAVIIDSAIGARIVSADALRTVSCRMVIRALGADEGVPIGATQGSMSGLGYSQSWTIGSGGGATGELYLGKLERSLLGVSNRIGFASSLVGMIEEADE